MEKMEERNSKDIHSETYIKKRSYEVGEEQISGGMINSAMKSRRRGEV